MTGGARVKAGTRTIAWNYAEIMLAGAQGRGADPLAILKRVGVPADRPPEMLSEVDFSRLLRLITRLTRDEFWGLAPQPLPLGSFEALCRAAAREVTLGAALKAAARVLRIAFGYKVVHFSRDEGAWLITVLPARKWHATSEDALLFLIYGLGSWLAGKPLPLLSVDLAHGPVRHAETLSRYYSAPWRHHKNFTRLRLPEQAMALPVLMEERRLQSFLRGAPLGLVVRYRDPLSLAERVRAYLRRNLSFDVTLPTVADALAVSPQTLHRKLSSEGASYQTLKDETRRDLAIDLLGDRRRSLEEIALILGFAEHSSFHRAFRRWTGLSPGTFRPKN